MTRLKTYLAQAMISKAVLAVAILCLAASAAGSRETSGAAARVRGDYDRRAEAVGDAIPERQIKDAVSAIPEEETRLASDAERRYTSDAMTGERDGDERGADVVVGVISERQIPGPSRAIRQRQAEDAVDASGRWSDDEDNVDQRRAEKKLMGNTAGNPFLREKLSGRRDAGGKIRPKSRRKRKARGDRAVAADDGNEYVGDDNIGDYVQGGVNNGNENDDDDSEEPLRDPRLNDPPGRFSSPRGFPSGPYVPRQPEDISEWKKKFAERRGQILKKHNSFLSVNRPLRDAMKAGTDVSAMAT